jgi:hypothetical protein
MAGPRDRFEQGIAMQFSIAQRTHGWITAIALTLIVAVAGCGYRRPALAQVEALVTLDGEPVAAADVTLVPVGPGRAARGLANDAGQVVFSTYGSRDGVIPGNYKAIVAKRELTKSGSRKMEVLRSAAAPSDPTASESMVEFTDNDYRHLLPAKYAGLATTDLTVTVERRTRRLTLALSSAASGGGR